MIISIFEKVEDFRMKGKCTYKLSELLTISFLTMLCGGEDYTDMSAFASERARYFGLLSGCGKSVPSADTFERVFKLLEPSSLTACFREAVYATIGTLMEKQIAIDGKKLCGSCPKERGTRGNYLLNAWVTENGMMVAQEALRDKENEIVALPRLIESLQIAGAVISIDAIGAQRNVVKAILKQNANFFIAVKENQAALLQCIQDSFQLNKPSDTNIDVDIRGAHSRKVIRECSILQADKMEDEAVRKKWPEVKTIVQIKSTMQNGNEEPVETYRYYISNEDYPKAAYYNMLARGHWGIENDLHWCLDVVFREDDCRARAGNASRNLSVIRKLALQFVKNHQDKASLKKRRFKAALNNEYLMNMLKCSSF